ncbi:MAG: GTPase Era [bacterium]|nr:GTPase Era [bacterium]
MNSSEHKSGYAALIGRPNVGKSTLLNAVLRHKLSAVTPRAQTTRNRIFGVFDRDDCQIVFQDTPGILAPRDAMHDFMLTEAENALSDADVAIWIIDGTKGVNEAERSLTMKALEGRGLPLIVVFNKMDVVPMEKRAELQQQEAIAAELNPASIHYIAALYGDGVEALLDDILSHLQPGPKFFPPEQLSDRAERFFVEEIIREKAFLLLHDEVPYSLAVQIETMKERGNGVTAIQAAIHVERDSQKGIVLGRGGAMIKQIGTEARIELEEFLGVKVFLELWVRVTPKWRKKANRLKEFGYAESD